MQITHGWQESFRELDLSFTVFHSNSDNRFAGHSTIPSFCAAKDEIMIIVDMNVALSADFSSHVLYCKEKGERLKVRYREKINLRGAG